MPVGAREMLLIMRAQNLMTGELARAGAGLGAIGEEGLNAGQKLRAVGQGMQVVGGIMTAVGAAGVAFFASSVKSAVEYDNQVAYTQTQTRGLGVSFQQLSDIGMRVANAIPVPFKAVQGTLYDIFSTMNVNAQQAEMLETNFAKAAVAGQTDMQTAGRETMGVMNAFKIPVEDVSHVLDVQFQLVKDGAGTYKEFIGHLGQVVPSAVAAGQSFEQLAGDYAFATRNGILTAQASTAVARAMDAVNKPEFQSGLQQLGINFLDAQGKAKPLNEIVTDIATNPAWQDTVAKSGNLQQAFIQTFGQGTIQSRRFFDVAIPNYQDLNREVGNMNNSAGATANAYDIMFKQPQSQIQLLKNHFDELKVTVGNALIPVLNDLIPKIDAVFKWFQSLPGPVKDTIVEIGAGVAVFTLVAGTLGILVGSLMQLRGAYLAIKGVQIADQVSRDAAAMDGAAASTGSWAGKLGGLGIGLAAVAIALPPLESFASNWKKTAQDNADQQTKWTQEVDKTPTSLSALDNALDRNKDQLAQNANHWYQLGVNWTSGEQKADDVRGKLGPLGAELENVRQKVVNAAPAFGSTADQLLQFAHDSGITLDQIKSNDWWNILVQHFQAVANGTIPADKATQDYAKHAVDALNNVRSESEKTTKTVDTNLSEQAQDWDKYSGALEVANSKAHSVLGRWEENLKNVENATHATGGSLEVFARGAGLNMDQIGSNHGAEILTDHIRGIHNGTVPATADVKQMADLMVMSLDDAKNHGGAFSNETINALLGISRGTVPASADVQTMARNMEDAFIQTQVASGKLPPALGNDIHTMITSYNSLPPATQTAMSQAITNLVTALQSGDPKAIAAAAKTVGDVINEYNKGAGQATTAGSNLAGGFAHGISGGVDQAVGAATNLVNAVNAELAKRQQSPDTEGIRIGLNVALGYALGLMNGIPQIESAASRILAATMSQLGRNSTLTADVGVGLSPFSMLGSLFGSPQAGAGGAFGGSQVVVHVAEGAFKAEITGPVTPEALPDLDKMLDQKMDDFATTVYNKFKANR